MRGLALAAALVCAAGAASAQDLKLVGLDGEVKTLTAAQIAALPHESLTVSVEGKTAAYRGVELSAVLAAVGAPAGKALRGAELRDVVVVSGADGYGAALALAETDPMFRHERMLLADSADGAALPATQGPYRLLVEGDLRGARMVRMVTEIEVRRVGGE